MLSGGPAFYRSFVWEWSFRLGILEGKCAQLKINLPLSHRSRAAQRIHIPEPDVSRKIFESHFSRHFGSGLAAPHDAELRFGSLIQNVNYVAGLQLRVD